MWRGPGPCVLGTWGDRDWRRDSTEESVTSNRHCILNMSSAGMASWLFRNEVLLAMAMLITCHYL